MGLFDKKYCDVCGEKIGLLGNRKLEDGNLCKNCAKKLSPWFDERRHSTVEQIKQQLAYREENRSKAAAFNITRTIGKDSVKLYIDDNARKFAVNRGSDFASSNPDILDFSQAAGCDLEIRESRDEIKRTVDGKSESYNPPRYEYSYDFKVTLHVNHTYFDDMKFELNSSPVRTGEQRMNGGNSGAWRVNSVGSGFMNRYDVNEYNELVQTGNELKAMIDSWINGTTQSFGANSGFNQGFGASSNMNQGEEVRFGSSNPIPYTEDAGGYLMSLELNFLGSAMVSVCNPMALQNVGGFMALQNILATELSASVGNAVYQCGNNRVPFAGLASMSNEISNAVRAELDNKWQAQYGLSITAVSVKSFNLTENSRAIYDELQRTRMAQIQTNQQPAQTQFGGWTCAYCGAQNTGKFCVSCGARRED